MSINIMEKSLRYLTVSGVWPQKGEELTHRKKFYIKFFTMLILGSNLFWAVALHLVNITLKEPDFTRVTDDLIWLVGQFGVLYFDTSFALVQGPIAKIYMELSDFSRFGKPTQFDEYNKRLNFQFRFFDGYLNICMLGIGGWNILATWDCENLNKVRKYQDVCGMAAPTWMPFDFNYFPTKQILILLQVYGAIWPFKCASVISFLIMESLEHLVCRIKHLKELLVELVDEDDDKIRNEKLDKWMKYHESIHHMGVLMNQTYVYCLFLHVTISGVVFGIIMYSITIKISFNAVGILTGWICSLTVACYGGQRLMEESLSMGVAAFHTNWFKRDPIFMKKIAYIIQRTQERPLGLKAGPIAQVNLFLILGIMKTAYSFLNLMNANSGRGRRH